MTFIEVGPFKWKDEDFRTYLKEYSFYSLHIIIILAWIHHLHHLKNISKI